MSKLDALIKEINKNAKYEMMRAGGASADEPERLPTGIFQLDLALGGGVPVGRISVIYGTEASMKTTICLKLVAQAQRKWPEKKCVFFDVEGHFSRAWATQLGVDVDALVYAMPSNAEQLVDTVEAVTYADDVSVIVVDSLAALVTAHELNSPAEKAMVGTQGLLINKLYRKLGRAVSMSVHDGKTPTVLLINQIRFKVGVLMGDPECLHGSALVNFVDGRSLPIRKVVQERIPGPVWSYDEETQTVVPADIEDYHEQGSAKDGELLTVTSEGIGTRNGVLSATVTYTHKFLTTEGWVEAGALSVGDLLLSRYRRQFTDPVALSALAGTLVGDATLSTQPGGRTAYIRFEDSDNPEYAAWKAALFSNHLEFRERVNDSCSVAWISKTTPELWVLRNQLEGCRHPRLFFSRFSWLGFALWIMDDGNYSTRHKRYTLCMGRFKHRRLDREYVSECLNNLGFAHSWKQDKAVVFHVEPSQRIARGIAEYVPECMHYKLPIDLRVSPDLAPLSCGVPDWGVHEVRVLSVTPASAKKYRSRPLYDLSIKGTKNYFVGNMDNGVVVHNTMPGGPSFKFASSLTLRLYGKDEMDKDVHPTLPVFKKISAIIKKWKVPVVARNCEFRVALVANEKAGLAVGQSDDVSTAMHYLKSLGMLVKPEKEWVVLTPDGEVLAQCKLQSEIEARLATDPEFQAAVREAIVGVMMSKEHLLDPA